MPLVHKKNALSNLSNLVSNKPNKALKRALETNSPNNKTNLKKKNSLKNKHVNDENGFIDDPTNTIEIKIKNIHISNEKNKPLKAIKNANLVKATKTKAGSVEKKVTVPKKNNWRDFYQAPQDLPPSVVDYDKTQLNNIDSEPLYAFDIFQYYRHREINSKCELYMHNQKELSDKMRTVLVDWLVEVQQNFELNHETLYLAVKFMDHFLMRSSVSRCNFQLLGLTSIFIASKFDERVYPVIDDFIFVCDDAYNRQDIIDMEIEILKVLDFNLNYPLSYSFLRRYARCASLSIETLTLARYILESSLLEHSLVDQLDSKISAASLLLALKMKDIKWNETLEFYSGYKESDLFELMRQLNKLISTPSKYVTIKNKYLDEVFFHVARTKPLDLD